MKIEIETYRNQTIYYDDFHEKFVCDMVIEDNVKPAKRTGLKDIRKQIDDFVKANINFKPFKAIYVDYGYSENDSKIFGGSVIVITVEFIRKDGALRYSDENGKQRWASSKRDILSIRKYNPELLEKKKLMEQLDREYEANAEKIIQSAKPLIESIDTTFITDLISNQ